MRKLVAAATALSLLALSLPIAASAQGTKPPAGSTAPAQTLSTKTTENTSVVKPAKHHAKRHHRRHFAKHRVHRLAAYKMHRKHHAARRQHHARHHQMHVKHVVSNS